MEIKKIIKSALLISGFFFAQFCSVLIVFCYQIVTDEDLYDLCLSISDGTASASEQVTLMVANKLIMPALILADVIILIPLLISGIKNYKEKPFIKMINLKAAFFWIISGIVINLVMSSAITLIPQSITSGQYSALMNVATTGSPTIVLLATGILTPVIEEFIFRYGIIGIYLKKSENTKKAVIISALLFGIAHLNPIQSTYAFLIGLILGWVYIKSENLLPCVLIHVAINTSSVVYDFLPDEIKMSVLGITVIFACGYAVCKIIMHKNKQSYKYINDKRVS